MPNCGPAATTGAAQNGRGGPVASAGKDAGCRPSRPVAITAGTTTGQVVLWPSCRKLPANDFRHEWQRIGLRLCLCVRCGKIARRALVSRLIVQRFRPMRRALFIRLHLVRMPVVDLVQRPGHDPADSAFPSPALVLPAAHPRGDGFVRSTAEDGVHRQVYRDEQIPDPAQRVEAQPTSPCSRAVSRSRTRPSPSGAHRPT